MSKRKGINKTQVRERRNQLLESAAAAKLSVTQGVREMRAIAGMTQEQFARHRGVSARVIKAIELSQGNPTVATLNRIGQFFGLEVAFVPIMRNVEDAVVDLDHDLIKAEHVGTILAPWEVIRQVIEKRNKTVSAVHELTSMISELDEKLDVAAKQLKPPQNEDESNLAPVPGKPGLPDKAIVNNLRAHAKKK